METAKLSKSIINFKCDEDVIIPILNIRLSEWTKWKTDSCAPEYTYIYILLDPIYELSAYVGKSDHPYNRLDEHLDLSKGGDKKKKQWIEYLMKNGIKPIIKVLAKVKFIEWSFWEHYFYYVFLHNYIMVQNERHLGCGGNYDEAWTNEELLIDAKKYKIRSEWHKMNGGAYNTARMRGKEFFEKCCQHMLELQRIPWIDEELIEDAKNYETPHEWSKKGGGAYDAARRRGKKFLELCCKDMKQRFIWIEEELIIEAKKYKTRSEWCENSKKTYEAAQRRGKEFFEKCCQHMKSYRWDEEELIEDAKKYNNRKEWAKNNCGAYCTSLKKGKKFMDICCRHMIEKHHLWTEAELIKSAKKYENRQKWRQNESKSYEASSKKGIKFMKKCCEHMIERRHFWTSNELIESAKKYETKKEWRENNRKAYVIAFKKGKKFINMCCEHMIEIRHIWTEEELMEDAKKYNSKAEWRKNNRKAHDTAYYTKGKTFYEKCCIHMYIIID